MANKRLVKRRRSSVPNRMRSKVSTVATGRGSARNSVARIYPSINLSPFTTYTGTARVRFKAGTSEPSYELVGAQTMPYITLYTDHTKWKNLSSFSVTFPIGHFIRFGFYQKTGIDLANVTNSTFQSHATYSPGRVSIFTHDAASQSSSTNQLKGFTAVLATDPLSPSVTKSIDVSTGGFAQVNLVPSRQIWKPYPSTQQPYLSTYLTLKRVVGGSVSAGDSLDLYTISWKIPVRIDLFRTDRTDYSTFVLPYDLTKLNAAEKDHAHLL